MNPDQISDDDLRALLLHRAATAASELTDPGAAESQAYLHSILATPLDKLRAKLLSQE